MKHIIDALAEYKHEVERATTALDLSAMEKKLVNLQSQMNRPDFWNDHETAEKLSREASTLSTQLDQWHELTVEIETLAELAALATEDESAEIEEQFARLRARLDAALVVLKFSGEYDSSNAIMQISAGVGGTDAQDWAQMLLTMYTRYCERMGLAATLVEVSYGEEAGIKSATLEIEGTNAYGLLKSEKGVHRLVRLSPFNAQNLRQTSFALVDVIPQIDATEVELDPKDLRIDTYRSSGHGGQSVNTTDSAVRITHIPTGVSVAIQNERSQLKNKQKAMGILAAKLTELAREQHAESVAQLRGKLKSADWGAQIRSYVAQPYTKVKDHRTDCETSDIQGVLGGHIDGFVDAYLSTQLSANS